MINRVGISIPETNVRLTLQHVMRSLRSVSVGINQTHKFISLSRDPTYTNALLWFKHIYSPYLIDNAK